jgi:hypothetical protein
VFRKLIVLLGVAAGLALALPARASVSYEYITDQSTYNAAPGQTVTVKLYLQEVLTGASASLINSNGGLFSAGVGIQYSSNTTSTSSTISGISNNLSAIGAGGGFGTGGILQDQSDVSNGNAALFDAIGANVNQGPTADSNGRILLGTATITAGNANTTSTFTITSFKNSANELAKSLGEGQTISLNHHFDLDSDNNAPNGGATYQGANDVTLSFSVHVVVPEPGSLALGFAAAGACGFGALRRWRNRRKLIS